MTTSTEPGINPDRPLSKADIERMLEQVGGPATLVLLNANLQSIDLSKMFLTGANLTGANLTEANLTEANLIGANLTEAKLIGANLIGAKLIGANLIWANLSGADLTGANLRAANLTEANLRGANLRGANLRGANLGDANLRGADLGDADLRGADLRGADLRGADLPMGYIGEDGLFVHTSEEVTNSDFKQSKNISTKLDPNTSIIKFTIMEEPFTAQNFATLINAFTDFHTKLWLITRNRFGDLIDFSQTHNPRFITEANLTIERMSHNSPGEIEFKLDVSPKGLADGLNSVADGIGMYGTNKEIKKTTIEKTRAEIEAINSQTGIAEKKADSGLATEVVDRFIKSKVTEQELLNLEQARLLALKEAELKGRERIADIRLKEVAADRAELDLEKDKFSYALEMAQKLAEINPSFKDVITQALIPSIVSMLGVTGLQVEVIKPPQLPAPDEPEPQGS